MFSFKKKNREELVYAPVAGRVKALREVSDPVFSAGTMGPGFAVEPSENTVSSPVAGTIAMIFPGGHAMGIQTDKAEVLVHVGIDTVKLKGDGFQILVSEGQRVDVGTPLVEADFSAIREKGYATDTLCVVTSGGDCSLDKEYLGAQVSPGKTALMRCKAKEG